VFISINNFQTSLLFADKAWSLPLKWMSGRGSGLGYKY
jgi:hypothetical protein